MVKISTIQASIHDLGHLLLPVVSLLFPQVILRLIKPFLRETLLVCHFFSLFDFRHASKFGNDILSGQITRPNFGGFIVKRIVNDGACFNVTEGAELLDFLNQPYLPFPEGCSPCSRICHEGKLHFLSCHDMKRCKGLEGLDAAMRERALMLQ